MNIIDKETYIEVEPSNNDLANFLSNFKKSEEILNKKHVFINFSLEKNITKEDISVFLPYAESYRNNGMTFVIICSSVDVDIFPETFNIVPTKQEAIDVLEMENIQRDLGF